MANVSATLNRLYAIFAFGTVLTGILSLVSGVSTEVVELFALPGAMVVGTISIYWLAGGEGSY